MENQHSWRLYWPDGKPMAHVECSVAVALKGGEPPQNAESTCSALPSPSLLARIVLPLIPSLPKDDGDMMRFSVILETQGAEDIGQRSCLDDAQGFGQRRMTRRRSTNETKLRLLTPGQTASEKKRRLHAASSAQQRYDDQAQDRLQPVILPLLAARSGTCRKVVFNCIAKASQIRKPYSNQNVPVSSTSSSYSANHPAARPSAVDTLAPYCLFGGLPRHAKA
jgi:hypothetical protein